MSETKSSPPEGLNAEQVSEISGGCYDAVQIRDILEGLKSNYETLIDTMSHVIERVVGK